MSLLVRRGGGGPVLLLTGATAAIDAGASIIRHVHLESGLDLSFADQAVWHYSRFEAPFSSILSKNILGDHFSPLVAVLAPLYWVWSDARMLLIAQSVLVAASVVPVFLFAERRLGRSTGYLLAGAYAVFSGIQVGVFYDFHELAFAPLLIALSILLADNALREPSRRRWGSFWLVIVLLLAVKEDLSMFVAFFGIYLLTRRELRHGIALMLVGIVWYELATRSLIPHFAGGVAYAHWTYQELGKNLPDALWALIRAPWRVFTIGFSPGEKANTMMGLFAPFLFFSLGSRLMILALPLLAERFLSTNQAFWNGQFHYSLPIAPVLAMAAAAGLANLISVLRPRRREQISLAVAGAMLATSLGLTLGTANSVPNELLRPSFYRTPGFAAGAYAALRHLPPSASLATDDVVLPHASERASLGVIVRSSIGRSEYVLANVLQPVCCAAGNGTYAAFGAVLNSALDRMTPIYYDAGWLLARLPPTGQPPTNGVLTPMTAAAARRIRRRIRLMLVSYFHSLPCYRLWASKDPRTGPCFTDALFEFRRYERRLIPTIDATRPALRGTCAQLASSVKLVTNKLSQDLTQATVAAASPNRSALPAAAASAVSDENNLDLTGRLGRLLVLCAPRAALPVP